MKHSLNSLSSSSAAYSNIQPITDNQLSRCVTDLKSFYLNTLCQIKTNPLDLNSILKLESIFTNLYLQGVADKLELEYTELLTTKVNGQLPKRILIQGEAGAGKTTLCAKIAWDWMNNVRYQEVTLLPVVFLREVKTGQTIGSIIKTYLSRENNVSAEQLDQYITRNEDKVLTILDGCDELSVDMSVRIEDIVKIIYSEKHENSRVIVTTRPWKAHLMSNCADLKNPFASISVEGFTGENVLTYIKKFFARNKSAAKDLHNLVKEDNLIAEVMAPFPIFCSMLCHMWKEVERRKVISKLETFSQIFAEIISFLIDHYIAKQCNAPDAEMVNKMKQQIDVHFKDISKIAFDSLLKNQLFFDGEAFKSCRDAQRTACEVGILTEETGLSLQGYGNDIKRPRIASNVSFPHKLFQEFMAGLHLVEQFQTNPTEYERLVNRVIMPKAKEFRYLLYFATSQLKPVGQDIICKLTNDTTHLTNKSGEHLEFVTEVAFECHDKETSKLVEHNLSPECKTIELKNSMSAHAVAGYIYTLEQVVSSFINKLHISRFRYTIFTRANWRLGNYYYHWSLHDQLARASPHKMLHLISNVRFRMLHSDKLKAKL